MISRSPGEAPPSSQTGDCNLYVYVKKVHVNGRTYYYLVVEEYEGRGKRRRIAHISVQRIIKEIVGDGAEGAKWCGGWDLNPRRPTPSGPQPDPFGQARAPPHRGFP